MKFLNTITIKIISSAVLFFAAMGILNAENVYGLKNTIELSGSLSTAFTADPDSNTYSISAGPGVHYFPADSFHLGLKPFFDYSLTYIKDTEEYMSSAAFTPVLQIGYIFRLSDSLFFDLAPEIGYSMDYPYSNRNDDVNYRYMYYGLVTAVKMQTGNALINIYLQQSIKDHLSDDGPDGYYRVSFGLGFSVFFNN